MIVFRFHLMCTIRFQPLDVGKNVRIPINPVDRPKIGHRNLLGVVTEGLFRLNSLNRFFLKQSMGFTRLGRRMGLYHRSFQEINSILVRRTSLLLLMCRNVQLPFVPPSVILLFTGNKVSNYNFISFLRVPLGHKHCLCAGKCSSNRCSCKKDGPLCNSRWHNSLSCKNK